MINYIKNNIIFCTVLALIAISLLSNIIVKYTVTYGIPENEQAEILNVQQQLKAIEKFDPVIASKFQKKFENYNRLKIKDRLELYKNYKSTAYFLMNDRLSLANNKSVLEYTDLIQSILRDPAEQGFCRMMLSEDSDSMIKVNKKYSHAFDHVILDIFESSTVQRDAIYTENEVQEHLMQKIATYIENGGELVALEQRSPAERVVNKQNYCLQIADLYAHLLNDDNQDLTAESLKLLFSQR